MVFGVSERVVGGAGPLGVLFWANCGFLFGDSYTEQIRIINNLSSGHIRHVPNGTYHVR